MYSRCMHRTLCRSFAALLATALIVACGSPAPDVAPADLVLHNGKVVTVDDAMPEAEAIAVNGHTITAVGSNAEIEAYIGDNTEVIDLDGGVLPSPASSKVTATG